MTPTASLSLGGQTLDLLPERCLFWRQANVLLLADLHLGKAAHLRHHGIPVPEGHTAADLARLSRAILRSGAQEVILCGDFFHAPTAQSPTVLDLVAQWRATHPHVHFSLVIGNHDQGQALPPPRCGITLLGDSLWRDPFHLIHDPADAPPDRLSIAGHLHPLVSLPGPRRQTWRAPCFWWQHQRSCLVLPGFGSFTAGVVIPPDPSDTLHAICGETVSAVPPSCCRPAPAKRPRTARSPDPPPFSR